MDFLKSIFISKSNEDTPESRLALVIPTYENFHLLMCVADLESELFRDCSRGLEGGAFTTATLLNRKRAKLSKGKNDIDALKDFINLKAEAYFAHCFLSKYNLDPSFDNTPALIKSASKERKCLYLHSMVQETLKEILPEFRECTGTLPDMTDYPVRKKTVNDTEQNSNSNSAGTLASESAVTIAENNSPPLHVSVATEGVEREIDKGTGKLYVCHICEYTTTLKTVMNAHVRVCSVESSEGLTSDSIMEVDTARTGSNDLTDYFWNYKSGEFYIDSIFKLMINYEKHGNGLGMYVISKSLLPLLHSLGHSNYSNSIHRFICRVLTSSTPREAILLIWERFFNRTGREGGNIFKDRRIEFRIRILKRLLQNLGPNLNTANIQKTNRVVDVKEKLLRHAKKSFGSHCKDWCT